MKIDLFLLDDNGDALSGVLGNICLQTESGGISDESVYIESWLEALIDGLRKIKRGQELFCDLVEEPDPIALLWDDKGLKISYGPQEIFLEGPEDLNLALIDATRKFSRHFICDSLRLRESSIFKKIFEFAEGSA